MQVKSVPLVIAFATAAAGFAGQAAAQGPAVGDLYVGATLGAAAIAPKDYDLDKDKGATSARVSAGLLLGAHVGALPIGGGWPVAVEFGYQDIARHTLTYKTPGNGRTELTARGSSASVSLKIDAPITERFALYGKLGMAHNKADGSTPAGQTAIDIDGSRNSVLSALGMQYRFEAPLTLRAELVSFGKTSANSGAAALNVGLAYRF